jgi:FkbM family methyltransferase
MSLTRYSLSKLLHPVVRLPSRYIPATRPFLWRTILQPRFAWRNYPFVAKATFGAEFAGNTQDIIQRYIYYFGIWEPWVSRFIQKRLQPGDVVVDVGANIGYISLLAANTVGEQGRVVSIEASRRTFGALRANLDRNNASNVRAVNAAVSDTFGDLTLHSGPEDNCGMASIVHNLGGTSETVKAAPLSHWLTERDISEVRLIKIDVEGAELSVLRSIVPILPRLRQDIEIVCEVAPDIPQDELLETLASFTSTGFHLYGLPGDRMADYLTPSGSPAFAHRHTGDFSNRTERTELVLSRTAAESL